QRQNLHPVISLLNKHKGACIYFLSVHPSECSWDSPAATRGPWNYNFVNFKRLSSAFQENISNFIQAIHPPLICNEKRNCCRVIINYWPRENELQAWLTLALEESKCTDSRHTAVSLPNHFYF
uniref:Uncharacterized protein n=1 Tax=Anser brachyrhynchus TaxID=132585 RepID=A0A8B9CT13_9AVES